MSTFPSAAECGDEIRSTAARLRSLGFALCKPDPRTKQPTYKGWPARSLEAGGFAQGDQLGILGGPLSDGGQVGHALVVVDLDSPDAVGRADEYLPPTGMAEGRPGKPRSHRYYLVPAGTIPQWATSSATQAGRAATEKTGHPGPFIKSFRHRGTKGEAIRFLGTGGQCVCPPSVWTSPDGARTERREWEGGAISPAATVPFHELWDAVCRLASACGAEVPAVGCTIPAARVRPTTAVEQRATAYLANTPEAVSGQGGHNQLFAAARALVWGFNLPTDVAVRLLTAHYNPRCVPPWSEREVRHKCEDADRTAFGHPRGYLLDAAGGPADPTPDRSETLSPPWSPPVPFGRHTPPPVFPTDLLPGWLAEFVSATATATQTPPDAAAMLALAAVAGGLAGKVRYRIRAGWSKNANLYVVVAMEPGERKSAVFRVVFAPVREAEKRAADEARPRVAQAKAALGILEAQQKYLQNQAAKANDPAEAGPIRERIRDLAAEIAKRGVPVEPRFIVDDETPENLARTLIEQGGRLLQAAPEGTAFEIAGGRYADGENYDVYLKAHDGDSLRVGRVSRGHTQHDSPCLTCALAVQPDVLRGLGRSNRAGGLGFLARWLYAVPDPRVGTRSTRPPSVPQEVAAVYALRMQLLWSLATPEEPVEVPFGPAADDALAEFEARIEPRLGRDGDLHGLAAWGTKLAGEVARIAGTLHVAGAPEPGQPDPVCATAVEAAVRLADEFLIPHARRGFGVMHADPAEDLADRVLRWLSRNPEVTTTTRRQVFQGLKGGQAELKADDLTPALGLLAEHGYLRPACLSTGLGRPSERYDVNPLWDRGGFIPQITHNPPGARESGDSGDTPVGEESGAIPDPVSPPARRRFDNDDRPHGARW